MNQSLFDTLAQSRSVRSYLESFPTATGFVLKFQPVGGDPEIIPFGGRANPFCSLMSGSPEGRTICRKTFGRIRDQVARTRVVGRSCCFAGLCHVAMPVISAGEHIATLYGGQLMLRKPTEAGFARIVPQLVKLGLGTRIGILEQAWMGTPVVSEKQLQAITYLLETFAAKIARYAATRMLEASEGESTAVRRAKEFLQTRYAEPVSMPDLARHLSMSPSTFGKNFKRESGLTFTQYLTRYRVEKSKEMLVNPALPIRTIAFQSGFDSISQFNRSFRQYAGMSPSQYRSSLTVAEPPEMNARWEAEDVA